MSVTGSNGFDEYKSDIDSVERRVASEIDPGARALVVAIMVFVVLVSFLLPHTGSSRGIDVLVGSEAALADGISLPSRVFVWLSLVFSVGFSILALLTRRWTLAWIALAGTMVACPAGMLAVWSRQTAGAGMPGPGIGLMIGWFAVLVLAFHWARVVWSRTALQMAAEAERRQAIADRQPKTLLENTFPEDPDTKRG